MREGQALQDQIRKLRQGWGQSRSRSALPISDSAPLAQITATVRSTKQLPCEGSDPPELLELTDAALDVLALGIEVGIEPMLRGA